MLYIIKLNSVIQRTLFFSFASLRSYGNKWNGIHWYMICDELMLTNVSRNLMVSSVWLKGVNLRYVTEPNIYLHVCSNHGFMCLWLLRFDGREMIHRSKITFYAMVSHGKEWRYLMFHRWWIMFSSVWSITYIKRTCPTISKYLLKVHPRIFPYMQIHSIWSFWNWWNWAEIRNGINDGNCKTFADKLSWISQ